MIRLPKMSSQYNRSVFCYTVLLLVLINCIDAYRLKQGHEYHAKRRLEGFSDEREEMQRELEDFLALRQLAEAANPEKPLDEGSPSDGAVSTDEPAAGTTVPSPEITTEKTAEKPPVVTTEGPTKAPEKPPIVITESPTQEVKQTSEIPKEILTTESTKVTTAPPSGGKEITTVAPAEVTSSKGEEPTKAPAEVTSSKGEEPTKAPTGEGRPSVPEEPQQGGQEKPYWPKPPDTGESDAKCLNDEFHCEKTQKCILKTSLCDSISDCDYKEDELNCAKKTCEDKGMFKCAKSGDCLPKEARCNGYDECGDGSDEIHCLDIPCEERNMFMCGEPGSPPPYRCGYKSMRCDGQNDCGDNTDEMGCEWKACGQYRFRCSEGLPTCVSGLVRCDGKQDCWDNSDEKDCKNYTCQANWFMCHKGSPRCIEQSSQCDRKVDCADMSDENTCLDRPCRDNEFKCVSDGMCLHIRRACNGNPDCRDNSDEDGQLCAKLRAGYFSKRGWSDLFSYYQ